MLIVIFWVLLILLLLTLTILFPWLWVIFFILFMISATKTAGTLLKDDPEFKYRDEINKKIIAKHISNK